MRQQMFVRTEAVCQVEQILQLSRSLLLATTNPTSRLYLVQSIKLQLECTFADNFKPGDKHSSEFRARNHITECVSTRRSAFGQRTCAGLAGLAGCRCLHGCRNHTHTHVCTNTHANTHTRTHTKTNTNTNTNEHTRKRKYLLRTGTRTVPKCAQQL